MLPLAEDAEDLYGKLDDGILLCKVRTGEENVCHIASMDR